MRRLLKVLLACVPIAGFFAAMEYFDPSPWRALPGSGSSVMCRSYDYPTRRGNVDVVCRLLWCEQAVGTANRGGLTALWCEPVDAATVPRPATAVAGRWW